MGFERPKDGAVMYEFKPLPATKGCPFCGKQPEIVRFNMNLNYSVVYCYRARCKARPEVEAKTTLQAINAWNKRHD
jgi:Lar family restriction alleviation protein